MSKSLFDLARSGKWSSVKKKLNSISVHDLIRLETTESPTTLLIDLSIAHNQLDVTRILLSMKGYATNTDKITITITAIKAHYNEVVKLLLDHLPKEFLNYVSQLPNYPLLHTSIWSNNFEAFMMLLKKGANPNLKDKSRRTPLHVCVNYDRPKFAAELLKLHSLRLNVHGPGGDTALISAAYQKREEIFIMLIEAGANINSTNYSDENLIGIPRAVYDHDFRRFIINYGINVNHIGEYNSNMVTITLKHLHNNKRPFGITDKNIVEYLSDLIPKMESNVLNTQDFWGKSTLWYLVADGWWAIPQVRDAMTTVSWDIFQKNIDGETIYDQVSKQFDKKSLNQFIDIIAKSYINTSDRDIVWEKECRSHQEAGTSATTLVAELKKLKIKVPASLARDKNKLCILLARHTIEKHRKSYGPSNYFNLVQKIDVIVKPTHNFSPQIWYGLITWEFLLYKYILHKHSKYINNHLPTKAQMTKPTNIRAQEDTDYFELTRRWMFMWREINGKPTLLPPKYLNPRELRKKNLKQFSIFYLSIKWTGGHANSIIIDHVNKQIERYEPHGYKSSHYYQAKGLDNQLKGYFKKVLPNYQFLPTKEIYPRGNIQRYEHDPLFQDISYHLKDGYCAAWSMWYIDLILSNWDIINQFKTRKEFINSSIAAVHHKFSSVQKYIIMYVGQTGIPNKIIELVNKIPEFKEPNGNPEDVLITAPVDLTQTKHWQKYFSSVYSATLKNNKYE